MFYFGFSVMNLIYSGQQLFSYTFAMRVRHMETDENEIQRLLSDD